MARQRRRLRGSFSPLVLAGWLFADLSAALVVILLAAATDFPTPPPEEPEPSPSESSIVEPTEPLPRGMEQEPLRFTIQTDAAGLIDGDNGAEEDLEEGLREVLGEYEVDDRQAGFVIALGVAADPNYGVSLSTAANRVLVDSLPGLMEPAAVKNYWSGMSGGESAGTVIFEVYLFVTE
jgi:hypothetical protein